MGEALVAALPLTVLCQGPECVEEFFSEAQNIVCLPLVMLLYVGPEDVEEFISEGHDFVGLPLKVGEGDANTVVTQVEIDRRGSSLERLDPTRRVVHDWIRHHRPYAHIVVYDWRERGEVTGNRWDIL